MKDTIKFYKTYIETLTSNLNSLDLVKLEKILMGIKLTSQKIKFIHISTDHLYSNKKNIPNKESDVNIVNNYARTKFKGEKIAQKHNSIIIRTNFIGKQSVKKKKIFN